MADIELVIKIDERDYNNIEPFLNGETINGGFNLFNVLEIIKNGTPLKGHGRLIDAGELLTTSDIRSDGSEFTYVSSSIIDNAPTIIEADKEE